MSSTITADQWNQRKEEIARLYIDEGWTLKPVMRKLRSPNFDPTESQYRTRFKIWKIRKPRQNHQPQLHTAPSEPSVMAPQLLTRNSNDLQLQSQRYTEPPRQVSPLPAEQLIQPVPSSQVPEQWTFPLDQTESGLVPPLGHQLTVYNTPYNVPHHQNLAETDIDDDQANDEDLLDWDQCRVMVRNRTYQGQPRVERNSRLRCQPMPQQAKGIDSSSIIPSLGSPLPSYLEGPGQSYLPDVYFQPRRDHLTGNSDLWWPGDENHAFSPTLGHPAAPGLVDEPLY